MAMNRIESGRMPNQIPASDILARKTVKNVGQQAQKPTSDQIEFSQQARKAVDNKAPNQDREALVEAARRKLDSGELDNPGVYEKTAAKLLKSGDLEKA